MLDSNIQQEIKTHTTSLKKRTLSPKYKLWQQRSWILFRLKGVVNTLYNLEAITESERIQLNAAFNLINSVLINFTTSSKELGFNAKKRCNFCGCKKVSLEGSIYCSEHHKIMLNTEI